MNRILRIIVIASVFVLLQNSLLSAAENRAYTYDENGNPVQSIAGYEPYRTYFGTDLGIGSFTDPNSIFIDKQDNIYILDSGNGRIIKVDKDFKNTKIIDTFTLDGESSPLNSPESIFVSGAGLIYIADTANERIIAAGQDGAIQKVYTKPTSELFPQNVDFRPVRVVCDDVGTVFAICTNVYKGAVYYSEQGDFLGLYGSNRVEVTFTILADRVWRRFFSRDMRDKFAAYIPVEYSGFDIDSENFIYTCTANTTSASNMVRKLNTLGDNIIEQNVRNSYQGGFGDLNPIVKNGELTATKFIDIEVNPEGFINCLDFTKGRIFQYDQEGNLIFTFGGIGNEMGNFITPVEIESYQDKILVLDKSMNSITVFKLTEFGNKVHQAFALYNAGQYVESIEPWKQVLKMNSNYNIAYLGIGKAMMDLDRYKEAMDHFRIAGYIKGYDQAYNLYRTINVRQNFWVFFLAAGLLMALLIVRRTGYYKTLKVRAAVGFGQKPWAAELGRHRQSLAEAWNVNFHPITGYSDLFYRRRQSVAVSILFAFLLFMATLLKDRYYGFSFVGNAEPGSILMILLKSLGISVLFVVVNWSISTLFDGKGDVRKIWIVLMYSLQPYILTQFAAIVLSNFLKLDEGIFITYLVLLSQVYSVFLLIKGLEAIHEYSFLKCIVTMASSLLGIALIAVLLVLILSLAQQIIAFVITVYKEFGLRFR